MRSPDPIVITGAGLVTALGLDSAACWDAVRGGRCGIRPLSAIESGDDSVRDGGQAPDLPADRLPDAPREVRYLRHALDEACRAAGIAGTPPCPPERCGVVLGTTLAGMRAAGRYLRTNDFTELQHFLAGQTLQVAVADLGATGFSATTCSACASGLSSVAIAMTLLRAGELDLVIAGGYDTLSEYAYGGFRSLRLVAERALQPFSTEREGMKLGEGYGIVVLERARDATRRGATALAEVAGAGEACDGHHLTQPHPEGAGAARAIRAALADAGLEPDAIDLVAAHATATPNNDAAEHAALRAVFGDELASIPAVAFKSHLGHTLGGAGAVELILSMHAMRDGRIPPTVNTSPELHEFPDIALRTGTDEPATITHTLNLSLGFGGTNACVILGPPPGVETASVTPTPQPQRVLITGVGVVSPVGLGLAAMVAAVDARSGPPDTDSGPVDTAALEAVLEARRMRRMCDYVKLLLGAARDACASAAVSDMEAFAATAHVILGTMHGSPSFTEPYYRQIVDEGLDAANPVLFAEGVPNVGSAHMSLMLGLRGSAQTILGTRTAGLDALQIATMRIARGDWTHAIIGAAEEPSALINDAYRACGLHRSNGHGFVAGHGAVALVLESATHARERGATVLGEIEAVAARRFDPRHPDTGAAAVAEAIEAIGTPAAMIESTNGTWIDGVERRGLARVAAGRGDAPPIATGSAYACLGEAFSALPLAGLAYLLGSGRLPPGGEAEKRRTSDTGRGVGDDAVGVLACDFAGDIRVVRVRRGNRA